MKGVLLNTIDSKGRNTIVIRYTQEYNDAVRDIDVSVDMHRFNNLKSAGYEFVDGQEVDFYVQDTDIFPYQKAVIQMEPESDTYTTPSNVVPKQKKTKKINRITLWLSGFCTDEVEIDCDDYDTSGTGAGYYYFYNEVRGKRIYVGHYPISKTIIHEVREIEVEDE